VDPTVNDEMSATMTTEGQESIEDVKHQGIQVIARSAQIMRALGAHPQGLSLAGIAQEAGLPRSTVQRIVNALEEEFLVESLGPGGGFRLGIAVGKLFYQTQADIISVVRPYLETLARQLNESTYLMRQTTPTCTVVDRIIAERELRVVFPVGVSGPLHSTAAGKVLLASMCDEEVAILLPTELSKETSKSLNRAAVLGQIPDIRRLGYATDDEEQLEGISSIAVALDTYMGVFSIGIALPITRKTGELTTAVVQALQECKYSIEQRIGMSPARARDSSAKGLRVRS